MRLTPSEASALSKTKSIYTTATALTVFSLVGYTGGITQKGGEGLAEITIFGCFGMFWLSGLLDVALARSEESESQDVVLDLAKVSVRCAVLLYGWGIDVERARRAGQRVEPHRVAGDVKMKIVLQGSLAASSATPHRRQ